MLEATRMAIKKTKDDIFYMVCNEVFERLFTTTSVYNFELYDSIILSTD